MAPQPLFDPEYFDQLKKESREMTKEQARDLLRIHGLSESIRKKLIEIIKT